MKRSHPWALGLALVLVAACGDDEASSDTGASDASVDAAADVSTDAPVDAADAVDGPDATPEVSPDIAETSADSTPPRLRDVRVSVSGATTFEGTLDTEDVVLLLPLEADAEIVVFASDDESDAEALVVSLVAASGAEIPLDGSEFRNGLWRLDTTIRPGLSLAVEVADEAGNVASPDASLVVPTLDVSLVDSWDDRRFDEEQSLLGTEEVTYDEDGTWTRTLEGAAVTGTWSYEGGVFTSTETSLPAEMSRSARRVSGTLYVDDIFATWTPFERSSGAAGDIEGEWSTSYRVSVEDVDGFPEPTEVVWTVSFADDGTWEEAYTPASAGASRAGTWEVVVNDNYTDNLGNFVVRTVTQVDGEVAEQDPIVELFRVRAERLLLAPLVRAAVGGEE